MRSHLVEHFRRRRSESGLKLPAVARQIGYRSVAGACNKLKRFEQRGEIHVELLLKVANALGIEMATIDALIEQDRGEFVDAWNRWADEPILPHLVVPRWTSGARTSCYREVLPRCIDNLTAAECYASRIAWNCGATALVWNRRLTVRFNSFGQEVARIVAAPDEQLPAKLLPGIRPGLRFAAGDVYLCIIGWPTSKHGPSHSVRAIG